MQKFKTATSRANREKPKGAACESKTSDMDSNKNRLSFSHPIFEKRKDLKAFQVSLQALYDAKYLFLGRLSAKINLV